MRVERGKEEGLEGVSLDGDCSCEKMGHCFKFSLTFHVELPALIVEAVRDLVPDNPADGAVVHVARPILGEEDALHK